VEQGWHQRWRQPMREALDWLRDALAPRYEERARSMLRDPWAARDGYIDVLLDRSVASVDSFLASHATRPLSPAERAEALQLLEVQRHAMLMFTSCGWFFDEISGLEAVQMLRHAARALRLAEPLLGNGLEGEFLRRLETAESNLPQHGNGRRVYETLARPES
jgi:alpha-amylase/alpha-mannosidase (GH57 family)